MSLLIIYRPGHCEYYGADNETILLNKMKEMFPDYVKINKDKITDIFVNKNHVARIIDLEIIS